MDTIPKEMHDTLMRAEERKLEKAEWRISDLEKESENLENRIDDLEERLEELQECREKYLTLTQSFNPMLIWIKDIMEQIAEKERSKDSIDINDVSFRTARSMIQESLWEIEQ